MGLKERAIQAYENYLNSQRIADEEKMEHAKEEFKEMFGSYPERSEKGIVYLDGFMFQITPFYGLAHSLVPAGRKKEFDFYWIRKCDKCGSLCAYCKVVNLYDIGMVLKDSDDFICNNCEIKEHSN